MLGLRTPGAEPDDRSPAAQDVERGNQLREVRNMAKRDRADEHAEANSVGHGRHVGECRVALEHRVPRPPDLRDLDQMIHHPEAVEPDVFGIACDSRRASLRSPSTRLPSRTWTRAARIGVRREVRLRPLAYRRAERHRRPGGVGRCAPARVRSRGSTLRRRGRPPAPSSPSGRSPLRARDDRDRDRAACIPPPRW